MARWLTVLAPDAAPPQNRCGVLFQKAFAEPAAQRALRRSAILDPSFPDPLINLSNLAKSQAEVAVAERLLRRAAALDPGNRSITANLAFLHLLDERFATGWALYRDRETPDLQTLRRRDGSAIPRWQGAPLTGPLLVLGEQGVGDVVMFSALLSAIRERVPALQVLVDPRFHELLERSFPGTAIAWQPLNGYWRRAPEPEAYALMGDLPGHLGLFIDHDPPSSAYLIPDGGKRRVIDRFLGENSAESSADRSDAVPRRPRIGVTWRSAAPTGGLRTLSYAELQPLLDLDAQFVSLQYGLSEPDIGAMSQRVRCDHGIEPLQDLDSFAALISALDLVITPANNTAHFAAALGVPCWVMLPVDPDWRWGLHRDDSRWYPGVRVFRQRDRGDWAFVVRQIDQHLKTWLSRWPNGRRG